MHITRVKTQPSEMLALRLPCPICWLHLGDKNACSAAAGTDALCLQLNYLDSLYLCILQEEGKTAAQNTDDISAQDEDEAVSQSAQDFCCAKQCLHRGIMTLTANGFSTCSYRQIPQMLSLFGVQEVGCPAFAA